MPRRLGLAAVLVLGLAAPAWADPPGGTAPAEEPEPDGDGGVADQEIGVRLGLVAGGRSTPGGLRVGGQYLYQLDDDYWFDGAVLFSFGGGEPSCFRDRADQVHCDQGPLDGFAGEVSMAVRWFLAADRHGFHPYVRVGAGVRVVRFPDDDVSGIAVPLTGGGGVRVRVADRVAVGLEAQLELGAGILSGGLGLEPQAGLAVGGTVEFALP